METGPSKELVEIKQVLRSLVVSLSTKMDVRQLMRDYREMNGTSLPIIKFGHRDPVEFLKERCSDILVFSGPPNNPIVTPIITDKVRHIDQMIKHQKMPASAKGKGKRISLDERAVRPVTKNNTSNNFANDNGWSYIRPKPASSCSKNDSQNYQRDSYGNSKQPYAQTYNKNSSLSNSKNFYKKPTEYQNNNQVTKYETKISESSPHRLDKLTAQENQIRAQNNKSIESRCSTYDNGFQKPVRNLNHTNTASENTSAQDCQYESRSSTDLSDSGNRSMSDKSQRMLKLEQELSDLMSMYPNGILHFELLKYYEKRFGRPLKYERLGFSSVMSMCHHMTDVFRITRPTRDGPFLLSDIRLPVPTPKTTVTDASRPTRIDEAAGNADEALPEVYFDPWMYPKDSMKHSDYISAVSVDDLQEMQQLPIKVAEVYSPSLFWLQRVGDHYNAAMEAVMDEMNVYYVSGEGRHRFLPKGAIRVGQYCAAKYYGEWHRSVIVQLLDNHRLKVRHIDYGTVDTVSREDLKPLLLTFASVKAQAVRARLINLKPVNGMSRWPLNATTFFLDQIKDKTLVATVVAIDTVEQVLFVYLTDTNTEVDRHINDEMVNEGFADIQSITQSKKPQPFYLPTFNALENADALNYADLLLLKRYDIAVDEVESWRKPTPKIFTVEVNGEQHSEVQHEHPDLPKKSDEGNDSGDDNRPCELDRTLTPQPIREITASQEEILLANGIERIMQDEPSNINVTSHSLPSSTPDSTTYFDSQVYCNSDDQSAFITYSNAALASSCDSTVYGSIEQIPLDSVLFVPENNYQMTLPLAIVHPPPGFNNAAPRQIARVNPMNCFSEQNMPSRFSSGYPAYVRHPPYASFNPMFNSVSNVSLNSSTGNLSYHGSVASHQSNLGSQEINRPVENVNIVSSSVTEQPHHLDSASRSQAFVNMSLTDLEILQTLAQTKPELVSSFLNRFPLQYSATNSTSTQVDSNQSPSKSN